MTKTHSITDSPNGPLLPLQRKFKAPAAFLEVLYKPPRMNKGSHICPHLPYKPGITDIKPQLPCWLDTFLSVKVCRFQNQDVDAPPLEFTTWPQGPPYGAFHDHSWPQRPISSWFPGEPGRAAEPVTARRHSDTSPARQASSSHIFCDLCIFQTSWPSIK